MVLLTTVQNCNEDMYDDDMEAVLTQLHRDVVELAKVGKYLQQLQQHQQQETLQYQVAEGFQKLTDQADRINALANRLEAEIFHFKEIALEVNQAYHAIQQPLDLKATGGDELRRFHWRPLNIWEVHSSAIPTIVRHKAGFILTVKTVDLFKAERESNFQRRAKAAQRCNEAFQRWLAEKR